MKILKLILSIIVLGLIYLNCSLYYEPEFKEIESQMINEDVYYQLQFLKYALKDGADIEMQGLFPEGFVFINSLYGLSWCDLIEDLNPDCTIYKEGMEEISISLKKIDSEYGKSVFSERLPLKYGAFYRGWSNYLLGKKLKNQPEKRRLSTDIAIFRDCDKITYPFWSIFA